MPFAFIIIGAVFIASGVNGKSGDLMQLLKGDLGGKHSYITWLAAILAIGSVGYVEDLRPLSRAFLALVLIVLILSNGGFFKLFQDALTTIENNTTATNTGAASAGSGANGKGLLDAAEAYIKQGGA